MAADDMDQNELGYGTCPFCNIFSDAPWVAFRKLFTPEEAASELLFETPNFGLVVDIGAIVDGYCLILTKEHVPSLAYLDEKQLEELTILKNKLKEIFKSIFCEPIFFEHGAASLTENAGCCIDHAHLHIVPANVDLLPYIAKDYLFKRIYNLSELQPYANKHEYLYYENSRGEMFVSEVSRVPSQYMRRILCISLGNTMPWNWIDYVRYAKVLGTKERIRRTREQIMMVMQQIK